MLALFHVPLVSSTNKPTCSDACSVEFVTGCFQELRSYSICREQAAPPFTHSVCCAAASSHSLLRPFIRSSMSRVDHWENRRQTV